MGLQGSQIGTPSITPSVTIGVTFEPDGKIGITVVAVDGAVSRRLGLDPAEKDCPGGWPPHLTFVDFIRSHPFIFLLPRLPRGNRWIRNLRTML
ncbi:hypothetical protein SAY87_013137 [Trapa incisa]|uniref:Uncharacterized protein n=1 Tax=Trapa incisa TaxID=236973 RepID=A0AAN7QCR1_9MYRT|nr:hypothetical protein SAY87_013137 [Trapa incisa]